MRLSLACWIVILSITGSLVLAQDEPEITETPQPPINITIWWPDSFALVNNGEINPLLLEQSDAFAAQFPNVIFEHRLKAVGQTGGIMSTLRSASNAARDALPTLTLVRRQDLVFAHGSGFLQSMEGFPSLMQSDLNNTLQLGIVNDELFGVPYLLELQHMVYRPTEGVDYSSWTFDAVLARDEAFVFPAGRLNSLNDVVAAQYIESIGLSPFGNTLSLDETALRNLFSFYEDARDNELLTASILDYTSSTPYLDTFITGDIHAGIFSSRRYLDLYTTDESLAMAPIPSETGAPLALMNGWMWVMVTPDAEEQRVAFDYLNWMFNAERQAAVAEDVLMLPSRASAIRLGLANNAPAEPYLALIENAIIPLTEAEIGRVGREIQIQLSLLFTDNISAELATNAVINIVGE